MHLLIAIPALDEAKTIADVIGRVPTEIDGISQVEVLVIDDGSTDETAQIAEDAGATVLSHPRNLGVGMAFQSMVRHALRTRADILVTIDGDGQFNPADIPELIAPLLDGRALACTASRFADRDLLPQMPWIKIWGNRRVAGLVSRLTGEKFSDVSCGFRAYSREALLHLTVRHRFTYTHEVFLDLVFKRLPIQEVPLEVRGTREFGESRVAASVLRYGLRTAAILLRTYRDQRPLRLCFAIAVPAFLLGVCLLSISFQQWLQTGSWLKWSALTGGATIALGVGTVFFGFMADITTRLRQNQEEILYWLRRQADPAEAAREMQSLTRRRGPLRDVTNQEASRRQQTG